MRRLPWLWFFLVLLAAVNAVLLARAARLAVLLFADVPPGSDRSTTIALSLLFIAQPLLVLLASAFGAVWVARRATREKSGHCQTCGYDLRASPARCPECGTATGRRTP